MPGLQDLSNKYKSILKTVADDRQKEALILAGDAIASVNNRIINTGVGGDGKKFKLYSENPLPTFYFSDANAPSKVKKFKQDVSKKKVVPSYVNYRKALGLPTDKRTHTLTGEMLADVRAVVIQHTRDQTLVEIRASSRENQDKINWNSGEVGRSIIELNKKERAVIHEAQRKRIERLMKQEA